MKVFYLFRGIRGYNRAMLRIQEIGNHPNKVEIERRLKAIWLLERGQFEELKVVMNVSRSTVFGWRKRLKAGGNRVQWGRPLVRQLCLAHSLSIPRCCANSLLNK